MDSTGNMEPQRESDETEREACPECESPGELNRVVAGDEEWGVPSVRTHMVGETSN